MSLKAFCFSALMLLCASPVWAVPSLLVVDAQSGYVLSAKNADRKQYPASLTKVMTLYITFDALEKGYLKMDDALPISKHAASQPRSKLGVKAGETITVKEAILALIVKSANDVAVVLAEALAPSEEEFAKMMTQYARSLGLSDTTFKNASGLHHPEQVSTAKDMAVLTMATINHYPQYYPLFSSLSFKYKNQTYHSHNNILRYYEGAEGFKTGFVSAVGYNVISTAKRDGQQLVGVVIGENTADRRDKKMRTLLDEGFKKAMSGTGKIGTKKAYIAKKRPNLDDVIYASIKSAIPRKKDSLAGRITVASYAPIADDNVMIEQGDHGMGEWSIQVGAFLSPDKAQNQIDKVRGILKNNALLSMTPPYKNLYRARLLGFDTKQDATFACQTLEKQGVSCLAVAPDVKKY